MALIGLEVWNHQDMISVSDNPHSTLAAFLSWRSKQLRTLPNDNAQLITLVTPSLSPSLPMCHPSPSPTPSYPPPPRTLTSLCETLTVTSCTPVAVVQLEVITMGILCLQGEGVPGHHHRAGTSQSHVL